jgi:hypothetical protein
MLERRPGKVSARFKRDRGSVIPNLLINGDFQVAQRGAGPHTNAAESLSNATNSDDAYLLDMWVFLAEGSDTCDVSRSTADLPSGGAAAILLDVETANRKFGIAQFIESTDTIPLRSQTVSLSFKAKVTGSSISNIRAGVMAWDGTADAVTSDVVSAWAVVGTNPTLVANWTFENTPANLAVTTSWQTFRVEGVVLDTASTNNLGVFIWVDDTDATIGEFLYITDVRLEVSPTSSDYVRRRYVEELALCQRYFQRQSGTSTPIGIGVIMSGAGARVLCHLPGPMRIAVAPTFGAANLYDEVVNNASVTALTSISGTAGSTVTCRVDAGNTAGVAGEGAYLQFDSSGLGYMNISAEL